MSAKRKPFPLTDSGNAELIADMFGDLLRFNHQSGRWLIWHGNRWIEDRDGEVMRMAKLAARSRLKDASGESDDGERKNIIAWENRVNLRTA